MLSADKKDRIHVLVNGCISLVWLMNGLYSKILHLTPRHEMIVAEILGNSHAHLLTFIIGVLEVLMAIWIGSGLQSRLCAFMQIAIVLTMNLLEFFLVPGLLLWGRFNLLFAFLFSVLIYLMVLRNREHSKDGLSHVLNS